MSLAARCGVLAAVVLAASPPAAPASTASLGPGSPWGDHVLRYTGGPGEANDVTVELLLDRTHRPAGVRIVDATAVIEPGTSCRSLEPHAVACTLPPPAHSNVKNYFGAYALNLGDGDDALRFRPAPGAESVLSLKVDGGSGADTIRGLPFAELSGGSGPDRLIGPDEFGRLRGDAGADEEFRDYFELAPRPFAWRGGLVLFGVPCRDLNDPLGYEHRVPCRGSMLLHEAEGRRRLLGRGAVPGGVANVVLTGLGAQLARRPDGVLATVTVRGHDIVQPNGWTFRLAHPRAPRGAASGQQ